MAKLTERMKEILMNQMTIPMATATKEGVPNVVPINAKKVLDDETILISDQFFKKTLDNLEKNPQVALTAWEEMEGYQFKGTVTIETSGPRFEETAKWIDDMAKQKNLPIKCKGVIIMTVAEIYKVSPGPDAGAKVE